MSKRRMGAASAIHRAFMLVFMLVFMLRQA